MASQTCELVFWVSSIGLLLVRTLLASETSNLANLHVRFDL